MNIGAGLIPVGLSLFTVLDTQQPRKHEPIELSEKQYEFYAVGDEPVSHSFYFTNWTGETLQVSSITVSEPIGFVFASPKVASGKTGYVDFRVTEPRVIGDYEGEIKIGFKNRSVSNLTYRITGKFAAAIELSPLPAFFVATQKGKEKSASLDIFNRTKQPVKILKADSTSERFDLNLKTVAEGEHYVLTLNMKTNALPGRTAEPITVSTSDPARPTLRIMANTVVREQVYTFPESIDFGQIDLKDVQANEQISGSLSQTLTIYQTDGVDFSVTAESDIPFLKLDLERGENGDRYQVRVDVDPEKFSAGQVQGSIFLKTNDKEISQLEIPVKGTIIANSDEF